MLSDLEKFMNDFSINSKTYVDKQRSIKTPEEIDNIEKASEARVQGGLLPHPASGRHSTIRILPARPRRGVHHCMRTRGCILRQVTTAR